MRLYGWMTGDCTFIEVPDWNHVQTAREYLEDQSLSYCDIIDFGWARVVKLGDSLQVSHNVSKCQLKELIDICIEQNIPEIRRDDYKGQILWSRD